MHLAIEFLLLVFLLAIINYLNSDFFIISCGVLIVIACVELGIKTFLFYVLCFLGVVAGAVAIFFIAFGIILGYCKISDWITGIYDNHVYKKYEKQVHKKNQNK